MNIFQRFGCLLAATLFSTSVSAQVPAELDSMLRHTLDSMRAGMGARSLSAAIQFSDATEWAYADGISSTSPLVDVTPNDAYLIGSVTKTITSACILQLAEAGTLNLDDSLHEWLDPIPYVDSSITIRQLLQHTSGIYDVLLHPHNQDSMMANMARIWTPEELIDRFISPPLFQPGAGWSYSNTNYFLLSMIIKKATGNPFYTEIRDRFYTPLGLGSFAIPAFETLNTPVAHVWIDLDGDNVLDDANNFYMSYMALNSSAGAAGGYFATPTQCTQWMRTYMRGDLLSPAMMDEARTTVPAPGSQGGLYGLGLMKNQTNFLGYLAYGHGGDLAYHASSWYFPAIDASITVCTNDNNKDSWTLLPVVRELLRTYVNSPTAITSAQNATMEDVNVYPNPFNHEFTVALQPGGNADNFEAVLRDVFGRTVSRQAKRQVQGKIVSVHFDGLEALPKGVYFLTLEAGNQWSKTISINK